MRDQVELSAAIKGAMQKKKLTPDELGKRLGVSPLMVEKIICGDVVPSRHLEKQMIEILEINPERVTSLAQRRRQGASTATERRSKNRKAA
jgi:transcriptional regulator with XRE-family HTH domain